MNLKIRFTSKDLTLTHVKLYVFIKHDDQLEYDSSNE